LVVGWPVGCFGGFQAGIGLLDASKDEVANIEGGFPNVAIMIAT
jgi:hypothetical protein